MPIVKPVVSVADFEALIERYKIQNPVKYARKKEELERKLSVLKQAQGVKEEPKEEEKEKKAEGGKGMVAKR